MKNVEWMMKLEKHIKINWNLMAYLHEIRFFPVRHDMHRGVVRHRSIRSVVPDGKVRNVSIFCRPTQHALGK
jgi:hypothetical protein